MDRFDILVVDFPYVDQAQARRRPALVLSGRKHNFATGTAIIAMITRAAADPWPGDTDVVHYDEAGLHKPCKVRMKLHTVDLSEVRRIGRLHEDDCQPVVRALQETFST